MPTDRLIIQARIGPGWDRVSNRRVHQEISRQANNAMAKAAWDYARDKVPVRAKRRPGTPPPGGLRRNLHRTRKPSITGRPAAAAIFIDYPRRRARGKTNIGTGPYWRYLLGTGPRSNYRGNVRGGWPYPGQPTGSIARGRFDEWFRLIRNPPRHQFEAWYFRNLRRVLAGESIRSSN